MPRRSSRSRSHFSPLLLLPLLLLLGFIWFRFHSRPVQPSATTRINLTIERGQSLDSIARTLRSHGLIHSVPAFKLQVLLSGLAGQLQAGDFSLPPSLTLSQVVQALSHGTTDRWLTIPEGWRREQIAQALVDTLHPNNPDYAFNPDEFLRLTAQLEGQLFPDTYSFSRPTTASAATDRLLARHKEQLASLPAPQPLTPTQALVLASLIEREALTDSERPVIAGILLNRLQAGWPLQVDATVQYAQASRRCQVLTCDWWPQVSSADLQLDSPYNTYRQPGLPPGPIANPSLASIQAAYQPARTDYWFYLHAPNGQIHYARTLDEHNANIARHLSR